MKGRNKINQVADDISKLGWDHDAEAIRDELLRKQASEERKVMELMENAAEAM